MKDTRPLNLTKWDFRGDCVIVSGGARGIGAGIVRRFARDGADVLFGDVDATGGKQLCEELSGEGCKVHFVETDFTAADAWLRMREEAERLRLAPGLVVANVGIGCVESVETASLETYERLMNANLRSAWLAARDLGPALRRRAGSSLLLIGTVMARFGTPNYSLYATPKAALSGLLRSLCVEYGPQGVRVNMILPGFIVNDPPYLYREKIPPELWREFHAKFKKELFAISPPDQPLSFWGEPEDIAQAAAFLHSPGARYISGVELPVDGGLLCQTPIRSGTANDAWAWTDAMKKWMGEQGLSLP